MDMELDIQKLRLIVYGAVALYEGEGLEIGQILKDQGRADLMTLLDAMMTALYWLQETLVIE